MGVFSKNLYIPTGVWDDYYNNSSYDGMPLTLVEKDKDGDLLFYSTSKCRELFCYSLSTLLLSKGLDVRNIGLITALSTNHDLAHKTDCITNIENSMNVLEKRYKWKEKTKIYLMKGDVYTYKESWEHSEKAKRGAIDSTKRRTTEKTLPALVIDLASGWFNDTHTLSIGLLILRLLLLNRVSSNNIKNYIDFKRNMIALIYSLRKHKDEPHLVESNEEEINGLSSKEGWDRPYRDMTFVVRTFPVWDTLLKNSKKSPFKEKNRLSSDCGVDLIVKYALGRSSIRFKKEIDKKIDIDAIREVLKKQTIIKYNIRINEETYNNATS